MMMLGGSVIPHTGRGQPLPLKEETNTQQYRNAIEKTIIELDAYKETKRCKDICQESLSLLKDVLKKHISQDFLITVSTDKETTKEKFGEINNKAGHELLDCDLGDTPSKYWGYYNRKQSPYAFKYIMGHFGIADPLPGKVGLLNFLFNVESYYRDLSIKFMVYFTLTTATLNEDFAPILNELKGLREIYYFVVHQRTILAKNPKYLKHVSEKIERFEQSPLYTYEVDYLLNNSHIITGLPKPACSFSKFIEVETEYSKKTGERFDHYSDNVEQDNFMRIFTNIGHSKTFGKKRGEWTQEDCKNIKDYYKVLSNHHVIQWIYNGHEGTRMLYETPQGWYNHYLESASCWPCPIGSEDFV